VVLGSRMRRPTYLILGALAGLLLGTLVAYAFNTWYSGRFVNGDDDSNLLVSLLLFGFWPVSAIVGALLGGWLSQRRASGAKGET
jgi:sugar phosphate permease